MFELVFEGGRVNHVTSSDGNLSHRNPRRRRRRRRGPSLGGLTWKWSSPCHRFFHISMTSPCHRFYHDITMDFHFFHVFVNQSVLDIKEISVLGEIKRLKVKASQGYASEDRANFNGKI